MGRACTVTTPLRTPILMLGELMEKHVNISCTDSCSCFNKRMGKLRQQAQ